MVLSQRARQGGATSIQMVNSSKLAASHEEVCLTEPAGLDDAAGEAGITSKYAALSLGRQFVTADYAACFPLTPPRRPLVLKT